MKSPQRYNFELLNTISMAEYSGILDEQLVQAYMNAEYRVLNPAICIKIGEINPFLNELLMDNNAFYFAFITAENPFSNSFTDSENEFLMNQLATDLKNLNLVFLKGIGIDPSGGWPGENSFFILDINPATAIELGKKYEQNAIVIGKLGDAAKLELLIENEGGIQIRG